MRLVVAFLLAVLATSPSRADEAALWRALAEGGHVAIMRHATAPGVGDPPNFNLADPSTQRNLSDAGRAEARAIGARFRENRVAVAKVLTSQWRRCRETAELLDLGPVADEPRINSFFGESAAAQDAAAAAGRSAVLEAPRSGPIAVLVTHQVNVTALTGVYPASGEIVVARVAGDAIEVVGTIRP